MNAQVQMSGSSAGVRSTASKSNSLYTPTCPASDRKSKIVDPDLSDYYSDSGYPTRPRPRHILWTSSSRQFRTVVAENGLQGSAAPTANGHRSSESLDTSRSRRLSVPAVLGPRAREVTSVKSKAFSKLRSLRNNRIIPVSSPGSAATAQFPSHQLPQCQRQQRTEHPHESRGRRKTQAAAKFLCAFGERLGRGRHVARQAEKGQEGRESSLLLPRDGGQEKESAQHLRDPESWWGDSGERTARR